MKLRFCVSERGMQVTFCQAIVCSSIWGLSFSGFLIRKCMVSHMLTIATLVWNRKSKAEKLNNVSFYIIKIYIIFIKWKISTALLTLVPQKGGGLFLPRILNWGSIEIALTNVAEGTWCHILVEEFRELTDFTLMSEILEPHTVEA